MKAGGQDLAARHHNTLLCENLVDITVGESAPKGAICPAAG